jgi:hypothetical protein
MPKITFTNDTPKWIRSLVTKAAKIMVPEWEIKVVMVSKVDKDCPDKKAEVSYHSDYLCARICYCRDLKNNKEGKELVIHEIVHLLLSKMDQCAKRLISNSVVLKTAWKSYEGAEEEAVVRISRLLVELT